MNPLSSSRPQPLLHGDRKWWFRRTSGVRHGKWLMLVVKPHNFMYICILKSLYFHRVLTFICTLEVYSHDRAHVIYSEDYPISKYYEMLKSTDAFTFSSAGISMSLIAWLLAHILEALQHCNTHIHDDTRLLFQQTFKSSGLCRTTEYFMFSSTCSCPCWLLTHSASLHCT